MSTLASAAPLRGEPITVGFQHVARLVDNSFMPSEFPGDRFRKLGVPRLNVALPDQIASLDADAIKGFLLLQEHILAPFDVGCRWEDQLTGAVHPLHRSTERAALLQAAIDTIDTYHCDVLDTMHQLGPQMALLQIREIIRANGFQCIEHPDWRGLVLHPLDAPPLRPEFPEWLVVEEMTRLRPVFAHLIQAPLRDDSKTNAVIREAAEERLRNKQNALLRNEGIDLSRYESLKRSDRRRRAKQTYKRLHTRIGPSFPDQLLAAIAANPDSGTKELARKLGRRPATVSTALRELEKGGRLWRQSSGQKHRWIPVPGMVPPAFDESATRVRVASERARVSETAPREDGEAEEVDLRPRRRALSR